MSDELISADGLLALARDHDAGVDIDSQPRESSPTPSETASSEQESSNEVTASKEFDGGEKEVSTKSETETKAAKTEPKVDKEKSSKFAQEQNRKAKTWEQINAEKEALKAEREAVKREREEWSRSREQSKATETNSHRDEKGYTADDYEAAAKEFEADGDSQLAKAARAKADNVRKAAGERQQKVQQEQFQKSWAENYGKLSEKEAWLKDQNSSEYKRTVQLLNNFPLLTATPDGLVHAVEIVKLQNAAERSQSMEAENKSLKEQLSKLQQKTAIGKSVPAGQLKAEEKDFSKLSLKEQRDALMRATREFDRDEG